MRTISINLVSYRTYLVIMALLASVVSWAQETTQTFTMEALSQYSDETGVISEGDGVYVMTKDLEIPAGNTFSISGTSQIKMADGVRLTIDCYADFNPNSALENGDKRVLITRTDADAKPQGIFMAYDSETEEVVTFSNIDFEYVGLRNFAVHGFEVRNCTFRYANGALTGSGALGLGTSGAYFYVEDCVFEDNEVPAIGGAANYSNGLYIENCRFINNNTQNTNKPQLNLTVGGDMPIVIKNCEIIGTGLNMVGGIAIGNMLSLEGANEVTIDGCLIKDHRYGITGIGPMKMIISNNELLDNNHESNPMNGGSGISLAGYGTKLDAVVSGNHIENSLWGITIINCNDVNLGQIDNADSPGNNVFVNNGNGGVQYDLYNNQVNPVYAQNNTWSVPEQTAELIETVIFHAFDDSKLGEVIYMPAKDPASVVSVETQPQQIVQVGENLFASDSQSEISVYDVAGRKVANGIGSVSIENLDSGMFIGVCKGEVLKFVK